MRHLRVNGFAYRVDELTGARGELGKVLGLLPRKSRHEGALTAWIVYPSGEQERVSDYNLIACHLEIVRS